MGSSAVRSFSDPDEYDRAIRASDVSGLRLAKRGFQSEITRVDLGAVWMQRFQETAPRLLRVAVHPSRSAVLFRTPGGNGGVRHRGKDFGDDVMMFLGSGAVDNQTSDGPIGFGSVSLSPTDLARFGLLLAERDLIAPRTTTMIRPPPNALARLRLLHAGAARLARTDPHRLEHEEVSRALEDSLITAMVDCLGRAEPIRGSYAGERRAALIRRMDEHLQEQDDFPVYVTELCQALGVSERSLERACQDHLSMGPKRYLGLRRLHMARRALIGSDPSCSTVSQIALAHGFWELGRFAVRYQQAFGEPPSATLRGLSAAPRRPGRHSR
ncbi:MAG TPA: helix-turn-helix domain-containing protein [Roseiarcus sp.]|jgi:AraC-like DNA-binding protein